MKRLSIAFLVGLVSLLGSKAAAQESAKVQVTIKVPAKVASFTDQRLVVMLYHDHPTQKDRGKTAVDKHVVKTFSHTMGKETVLTIDVGEKAKVNPNVQYLITVTIFDSKSKQTHVGEKDGRSGPCPVVTNGEPNRATLIVRPLDGRNQ